MTTSQEIVDLLIAYTTDHLSAGGVREIREGDDSARMEGLKDIQQLLMTLSNDAVAGLIDGSSEANNPTDPKSASIL